MVGDKLKFEQYSRQDVPFDKLELSAKLFSEHYGHWSDVVAADHAGKRLTLTAPELKDKFLPEGTDSSIIQISIENQLVGHVFIAWWTDGQGRRICWVTHVLVHTDYRHMYLASFLLLSVRRHGDDVFGMMNPHPYACKAFNRAFGKAPLQIFPLSFARQNASEIMNCSTIPHVRNAELKGHVFSPGQGGLSCGVYTGAAINLDEVKLALSSLQEPWPFGDLNLGEEYLMLCPKPAHERTSAV